MFSIFVLSEINCLEFTVFELTGRPLDEVHSQPRRVPLPRRFLEVFLPDARCSGGVHPDPGVGALQRNTLPFLAARGRELDLARVRVLDSVYHEVDEDLLQVRGRCDYDDVGADRVLKDDAVWNARPDHVVDAGDQGAEFRRLQRDVPFLRGVALDEVRGDELHVLGALLDAPKRGRVWAVVQAHRRAQDSSDGVADFVSAVGKSATQRRA